MRFLILAVVLTFTTGKPLDEPNDLSAPVTDVSNKDNITDITDSIIPSQSDKLPVAYITVTLPQLTTKPLPEVTQSNYITTANTNITYGVSTSGNSLLSSLRSKNTESVNEYKVDDDETKTWLTTKKDSEYDITTLTPKLSEEITDIPNAITNQNQNIDSISGETAVIKTLYKTLNNEFTTESDLPFTSTKKLLTTEFTAEFTTPDALTIEDTSETVLPVESSEQKYDFVTLLVPFIETRKDIPEDRFSFNILTTEEPEEIKYSEKYTTQFSPNTEEYTTDNPLLPSTTTLLENPTTVIETIISSKAYQHLVYTQKPESEILMENLKTTTLYPSDTHHLSEVKVYPKISEKTEESGKKQNKAKNQERSAKSLESIDLLELQTKPNDAKVPTENEIIWSTYSSSTIKPVRESPSDYYSLPNKERLPKFLESRIRGTLELQNTPNDEKVTTKNEIIYVTDSSSTIKPVSESLPENYFNLHSKENLVVNSKNFTQQLPNQMEKEPVILSVLETPKFLEQFKESTVPTNSTGRVTHLLSYTLYESSQEKTVLKYFIDYLLSLRK